MSTDPVAAKPRWSVRLRKAAFDHLFAFGLLDGFYLVALYALGSYSILDGPAHLALFGFSWWLLAGTRPRSHSLERLLLIATTVAMVVSGVWITLVPRYSETSFNLRFLHQIGGRPYLVLLLPLLLRHVRADVSALSPAHRSVARAGWALTKVSFWVGAYVSLLTVGGRAMPYHVVPLALGLPLLAMHGAWAARAAALPRDPAAFRLFPRDGSRALPIAAVALGCVLVAASTRVSRALWLDDAGLIATFVRSRSVDLSPSLAVSSSGASFRPEALGGSNRCGVRACHPSVFGEWRTSPHRSSVREPYRVALEDTTRTLGMAAARVCASCHDPISLFSEETSSGGSLHAPEALREGISCPVCHRIRPASADPSNGAVAFALPRWYLRSPMSLMMMVGVWREHREDFVAPELSDGSGCASCHRFRPFPASVPAEIAAAVLDRAEHRGGSRVEACFQPSGCLDCHMPRVGVAEKPGAALRSHRFDPPARGGVPR